MEGGGTKHVDDGETQWVKVVDDACLPRQMAEVGGVVIVCWIFSRKVCVDMG